MHSVISHLFTRTTNENEMDLSSHEKFYSQSLQEGACTIRYFKDINIQL